ncbi:hypothetical protein F4813DRAFT_163461 [Daldinia decipiens]|uniref:uncharacterized protein n=1 Tax=Daldinia decipiens TaxID=326647 RepID=UPI0020C3CFA2|nr:uncharacterized protein F4813DRAFT_163461 [Daldinia decipiens]KAI1661555.1 hypothetical protein F4813DRAFT_163461 [Daldinia decipiens]
MYCTAYPYPVIILLLSIIIYHHNYTKTAGSLREAYSQVLSLIKYLETRRLRLIVSPMAVQLTSIIFLELFTAPIRVSRQQPALL